jgi:hypothetical protein
MVAKVFISNGKKGEKSKIVERERERECVWVRQLTAATASVLERHICSNK